MIEIGGCDCSEHRKLQAAELQGIMIGMRYAQMVLREEYNGELTDEVINKIRPEVTATGFPPLKLVDTASKA